MTFVVAFDLDGTLVDTPSAIVATFTAVLAARGVAAQDGVPAQEAAIRATIGLPIEAAFGALLGVAPDDGQVGAAIRQYQTIFTETVLPKARDLVFPGVAQGLTELRGAGFTLAVATSKYYASADTLLRAAALRDHFALVVGADQVARPKPDPEMLRVIMQELGVDTEHTLMVGDTTHDLLMAQAADVRSVAVTYGVHGLPQLEPLHPTWVVETFDEVVRCAQAAARTAHSATTPGAH